MDIVVTNPPFSRLHHFIKYVTDHCEDVLLLVNLMALTYKEN